MAFFHQNEIDGNLLQMVLRTSGPSAKIESGNWGRNMSDANNSAIYDSTVGNYTRHAWAFAAGRPLSGVGPLFPPATIAVIRPAMVAGSPVGRVGGGQARFHEKSPYSSSEFFFVSSV